MKPKAVRIPDDLWEAALSKAKGRNESLSEVVRRALERYVKRG
jgi:predicted CopG family antitoxin